MKIATSVTVFQDAVGIRLSATYSVVDDNGKIIEDNKRANKVVTEPEARNLALSMIDYAQNFINTLDD